mgnify:CR=1 FL=1
MSKGLVVIGGGAAGMMAAVSAAERGARVTLLEPNERLGKKLNITGKGRCNVTNNADVQTLLANVPRNGKFLYSAFSRFDGRDTMAFFASIGVPLKTERGNRVFPVSDRAFDVSAALERRLKALKVSLARDRATELEITSGAVTGVRGERGTYPAGAVVLATGGVSYPATGSTGEGHRMAREAGHTVTDLQGSLVPLRDYGLGRELQGLSLRNVGLAVFEDRKKIYTDFGEMLFTHFGISGPLTLSASSHLGDMKKHRYEAFVDLKPALSEEQLYDRITRDFALLANHAAQGALVKLLPSSMQPVMVARWGIDPATRANQITREQKRELVQLMKHWRVSIDARGDLAHAVITSGGVSVREVDPKTMQSKKALGLYFAGEVLDVDAYTGGYNLGIAFATAYAAASHL